MKELFAPDQDAGPRVIITPSLPKKRLRRWLLFAIPAVIIVGTVVVILLMKQGSTDVTSKVTAKIEITKDGFTPLTIRIKKGESITWVNKDARPHQVASDPHPTGNLLPSLKSEDPLLQEEQYTAIFEQAGTFTYHDYLDPVGYQGAIIVE